MTPATKRRSQPSAQAAIPAAESPSTTGTPRKPWKKKTPTEVVLDQIARVREDVEQKEENLKQAKRQLAKLEEAARVLEST